MKKEFTTHELLTMPIDEAFKWFHDKITTLEVQVLALKSLSKDVDFDGLEVHGNVTVQPPKKKSKKNNSKQ